MENIFLACMWPTILWLWDYHEDKDRKKAIKSDWVVGVILIFIAICMLSNPHFDMVGLLLGGVGLYFLLGAILLTIRSKSGNAEDFYKKCCEQGIKDLSVRAERARAEIIAKDYWVVDLEAFYNKGKEMCLKSKARSEQKRAEDAERIKRERFEEKKQGQRKKQETLTAFAELFGREKPLAYIGVRGAAIDKKIEEALKGIKDARARTNAMAGFASAGKVDWGIAGGIADAIAGPGAGVVAALNAMEHNREINEYNSNLLSLAAMSERMETERINEVVKELKTEREKVIAELEAVKKKLVEELPHDELMKHVEFSDITVKISDTTAFTVIVSVSPIGNTLKIYDTVDAIIDGTFKAEVYQNDKKIGEVLMVLPENGLRRKCKITGICLEGAKRNVPYEVKIFPYKLWAIEK